jgi:galactitol-specific phosphotransferase system IIB component
MKKIGVEKGLENVAQYLRDQGCQVEVLSGSIDENMNKLNNYDCIVTSGLNKDALGISDTSTEKPVINARGLSPEEVAQRINSFK